jgi:hypothetical protein
LPGITGKASETQRFLAGTTTTTREPCQIRRRAGRISSFDSTFNRKTAPPADDMFDEAVD